MLFLLAVLSASFLIALSDEDCEGVEIVSRKEWGAREPFRFEDSKLPLNKVIIQHTVTHSCKTKPECSWKLKFVQDMHLDDRGWFDIAYNFLVGSDGRFYEGRGWRKRGAHSKNFNTNSLGIAYIGNYNKYAPNEAQINATLNFFKCGVKKGYLTPTMEIHGHRDVSCTQSPGDKLYSVIRQWDGYKGGRMPLFICEPLGPPFMDEFELDY